jgi:hypothetical protein
VTERVASGHTPTPGSACAQLIESTLHTDDHEVILVADAEDSILAKSAHRANQARNLGRGSVDWGAAVSVVSMRAGSSESRRSWP